MSNYTVKDIQVLEGLEAVRLRPGMYIGGTNTDGLHHLLWEIVDNAIDEAANGFADTIDICLYDDGSVSVMDNGRGIPTEKHDKLGVSGVEVVFTQLHAGGKFGSLTYGFSGGLHGVGASVVNALSKRVKVEVWRGGAEYVQEFASETVNGKLVSGRPLYPLKETGRTTKRGTRVTFQPDPDVFDSVDINYDKVARRMKELAFLIKGLTINISDRRGSTVRKKSYCYSGGISDYVLYLTSGKPLLHDLPIYISGRVKDKNGSDILVEAALQFSDVYDSTGSASGASVKDRLHEESIKSFVNNIPTIEGGMHETGFKTGFTRIMNELVKKNAAPKEKLPSLEGEDYREGLTCIISLKMKDVQFEGQTKTKLGNSDARDAVNSVVMEELSKYFADLHNAGVLSAIIDKSVKAAQVRERLRKAKHNAREQSKAENAPLVGKLSPCTGKKPELNELFIVEGDSAGGSAKMGRDSRFQAILPLRGKPLNVEKKSVEHVLQNEEYRSLITALGTGFGQNFNINSLRYHKIIIMADADQDGAHIRSILLTFFFRYFRQLIERGHVYMAKAPLYKVQKGKKMIYCHTDKQLAAAKKELGRTADVQRYKGLGEMTKDQLWETTLNPENRVLVQVTLEDAVAENSIIETLMGDKVEPRKLYISENAYFNKTDRFMKKGAMPAPPQEQ